jgi:hypothetical protein
VGYGGVGRPGRPAPVDVSAAAGVRRFVFVSIPEFEPEFPVQNAKRAVETGSLKPLAVVRRIEGSDPSPPPFPLAMSVCGHHDFGPTSSPEVRTFETRFTPTPVVRRTALESS